jgi:hypothetical protein
MAALRDENLIALHMHIEFGQSFHAANYSAHDLFQKKSALPW